MKGPLRICFVAQNFPIQSRSSDHGFLWPMARGLAADGHSVVVLSARNSLRQPKLERDGVVVFSLQESGGPPGLRFEESAFRKFSELHRESPFHIVHCLDESGRRIGRKKNQLGVKVAYDVEATQMRQILAILGLSDGSARSLFVTGLVVAYKFLTTYFGKDRELLDSADGVFTTTPQQKIFLERYYLFPEDRTYLVPYGTELSSLAPANDQKPAREKLKLPESASVVLTLSEMNEVETLLPVLRAFEKVATKKSLAKLIVIGSGPQFKDIERAVLDLALGSRVLFVGALTPDEIGDWISACDVYLDLGTRSTGYDPIMLEAMAQQKVVMASEVGPIANVIEDGLDGFLLRPADHESLAQLLIDCFVGAIPVHELGVKAREKVLHLFDARRMVSSLADAYRKILSEK